MEGGETEEGGGRKRRDEKNAVGTDGEEGSRGG